MTRALEVIAPGPLATVQDRGRPGLAALGVGPSGAADPIAFGLANRLLGNPDDAAAIEVTFGGLEVRSHGGVYAALTGAPCPMTVDGRAVDTNAAVWLADGAVLRLGVPATGLRSYLAVRGGLGVDPVLHSRSTDALAGIGPESLVAGTTLAVGTPPEGQLPAVDSVPLCAPSDGDVELRVVAGPRADWFDAAALDALTSAAYEVTSDSNRIGMRLAGPVLDRSRDDELPSEGMVPGALQVPPSGQPTLFLADHPVTGGYPVIAVVLAADLPRAAQARPGQRVRFIRVPLPGGDLDEE